ncbi:GLYCINE-RICH CELL WALL STRUCTURAL PROTEIN 1.8-LIKE [Salix viminalis]|uniref:GLYCINE-RICH CELL WALL STRUCTURAL PROTEIN 1.8-LIKE n=1 Tax=Salix viminalis TaxID=40686 RepID=A0A9Q0U8C5_SALVM|nr:GLYCINE-RICH CELL WALL STRUCTURAL PROTEIN 1.8-LIKE [Salix viminalis]
MSDPKTSHQPTPTPVSWAEKVKVSNANTRCTLEHLPRKPVGATLTIPRDMQMADVEIWERSMVGFFVSYKLPFHAVQAIASRIFKAHGLEKTMVLSNGFMVFRFSSTSAMEEVLARGPWMFGGKTVLLQKWTPGFQFDKNKIRAIPVWARLQGLPFPFWNKKGLSMAASMVASSLSEDPITVDVTYEWKPSKCDICKVFGHACKVQSREEDLNRKRDEVGETEAVVHPHPPIPKQVQKSSVAKEKATGKGDHEGSDMGDAEERNAGLLTRSQKGKKHY